MVHAAVDHALCRHAAVAGKDLLFQGARVHADADRHMMRTRAVCDHPYAVLAADVSGIDAQFGNAVLHGAERQTVIEMDIRYQRHGTAVHQCAHRAHAFLVIYRNAHDIASRIRQLADLGQRRRNIACIRIRH